MTDTYDSKRWTAARNAAMARDRGRCQDCGTEQNLHVHHVEPVRSFDNPDGAHYLSNLVVLCARCHGKWEGRSERPNLLDGRGEVHLSTLVHNLSADTIERFMEPPGPYTLHRWAVEEILKDRFSCDVCFNTLHSSRRRTDRCSRCGCCPKLWRHYRDVFPDVEEMQRRAERLSDELNRVGIPTDEAAMKEAAARKWTDDEWRGEIEQVTELLAYVGIHAGYDADAVGFGYEPVCPLPTPTV